MNKSDQLLSRILSAHLGLDELQNVSSKFSAVACTLIDFVKPGPERTVALRKLLEAKDAAVQATVHPWRVARG